MRSALDPILEVMGGFDKPRKSTCPRHTFWGRVVEITLFVILASAMAVAVQAQPSSKPYRFYHHIGGRPDAIDIAAMPVDGGFVKMVEVDMLHRPISDTLLVWVQHFEKGGEIHPLAERADLVLSCFPRDAPREARDKHALPNARGAVYAYRIAAGVLVVTDGLDERMTFAILAIIRSRAAK